MSTIVSTPSISDPTKYRKSLAIDCPLNFGTKKAQKILQAFAFPCKEHRAIYKSIHYEAGYVMATNCYTLIIAKTNYPKEYECKTLDAKGCDVNMICRYPNVPMALRNDEYERVCFNREKFISAVKEALDKRKTDKRAAAIYIACNNVIALTPEAAKPLMQLLEWGKKLTICIATSLVYRTQVVEVNGDGLVAMVMPINITESPIEGDAQIIKAF